MINHIIPSPNSDTLVLTISDGDIAHFRELIQRGAQTWADAPPQVKALADLITVGKIQQDYYGQAAQS